MAGKAAPERGAPQERSFHADVSLTLAARVVALLCGVATTVVVARALGPGGRGEVAVAINLALLLGQFGTLGFQSANPYYVVQERDRRDRIVWNSVWLAGAAGAVTICVGLLLKLVAPDAVQGLDWLELGVALSAIPASLAAQFLQSVLLGEGRMKAYNIAELTLALVTLGALSIAMFVFDFGVLGAIAVIAGLRYVAAAVFLWLARNESERVSGPDLELGRTMLAYGARVYLATLLSFLVIRIDLLLVNGYLGPDQAGLYSVAVALADGMLVIPQVVAINLFARIVRGAAIEQTARVFRVLALGYGLLCLITVPLAGPFIETLYGAEFTDSASLYRWLVVGVFCFGMLNVLAHHFAGRGFPIEAALVWFVGLAVNLVINLLFLESSGTYIASLASSIAYLVLLVLHARMFAREAGGYSALIPRLSEFVEVIRLRGRAPSEAG